MSVDTQERLSARELAALPINRPHHLWRWVAVAAVLVLAAQFATGMVTNIRYDWPTFARFFFSETILSALWLTIELTVIASVLGFLGGLVLALMRLTDNPVLVWSSWSFTWLFRSIPLLVQVLFWGFLAALYPRLGLGIPFGPLFAEWQTKDLISIFAAAVVGLTIHQTAYASEIIRAGLLSVDPGQLEAAAAFGVPRRKQVTKILIPQALRTIIPPTANEVIGLLKGTSVVFILALPDLFYQVQVIYGRNGRIIPLLMVAVVWYLVLTSALSIVQSVIERRLTRSTR